MILVFVNPLNSNLSSSLSLWPVVVFRETSPFCGPWHWSQGSFCHAEPACSSSRPTSRLHICLTCTVVSLTFSPTCFSQGVIVEGYEDINPVSCCPSHTNAGSAGTKSSKGHHAGRLLLARWRLYWGCGHLPVKPIFTVGQMALLYFMGMQPFPSASLVLRVNLRLCGLSCVSEAVRFSVLGDPGYPKFSGSPAGVLLAFYGCLSQS